MQMASYGRLLVIVGLLTLVVSNGVAVEGVSMAQTRKLQQLLAPVTNAVVGEGL